MNQKQKAIDKTNLNYLPSAVFLSDPKQAEKAWKKILATPGWTFVCSH